MKLLFQLLLFILYTCNISAQEFISTIWIENNVGEVDSVQIGYDPEASEVLDENFGGIDIMDSLWNDFEIRAAQVDIAVFNELFGFQNTILNINDITRYQTKTEIIPKKCLETIPVSNQDGFLPFIALFINAVNFPISIKWNSSDYQNECLAESLFTDWPVSTWWDVPISNDLVVTQLFTESNEISINSHSGVKIINEQNDTLIMFHLVLLDALYDSTQDHDVIDKSFVFPNPFKESFYLHHNTELLHLLDTSGNSIAYYQEGNTVSVDGEGVMIAVLRNNNEIVTQKILQLKY